MSHGSVIGNCAECGFPAMYRCEFCGKKLCNTHRNEHKCVVIEKTAEAIVEDMFKGSSYQTKIVEPEKTVDKRRRKG
jgi:methionyl-tRNA synthetase